jgi:ribonuclease HI
MKINCFIDGSCRINPHGEMGYAYIIEMSEKPVLKHNVAEPAKYGNTSVLAEYKALECLLLRLIEDGLTQEEIIVNTDSMIIYRQFNHGSKPRKGFYVQTGFEVARISKRFKNLKINWISRNDNIEADALASCY